MSPFGNDILEKIKLEKKMKKPKHFSFPRYEKFVR